MMFFLFLNLNFSFPGTCSLQSCTGRETAAQFYRKIGRSGEEAARGGGEGGQQQSPKGRQRLNWRKFLFSCFEPVFWRFSYWRVAIGRRIRIIWWRSARQKRQVQCCPSPFFHDQKKVFFFLFSFLFIVTFSFHKISHLLFFSTDANARTRTAKNRGGEWRGVGCVVPDGQKEAETGRLLDGWSLDLGIQQTGRPQIAGLIIHFFRSNLKTSNPESFYGISMDRVVFVKKKKIFQKKIFLKLFFLLLQIIPYRAQTDSYTSQQVILAH